jgi:hypothetical protein
MPGIFINYRREDSSAYAGRLYDALLAQFGRESVFMDIDAIGPGEDFREVIQQTCATCDVFLAVIGRSWATVQDKSGKPRLGAETDFVRLEISSALQKGLKVIPVLVGGADMPDASLLPPELHPLAFRNAWEVSDKRFHQDVQGLIEAIKKMLAAPSVHDTPPPVKPVPRKPEPPSTVVSSLPRFRTGRWGLIITLFYLIALVVLVVPATIFFGFVPRISTATQLLGMEATVFVSWPTWIVLALLLTGEALLLWLSVDTTRKRLKPRTHILVSAINAAMLLGLLTSAAIIAVCVAIWGDHLENWLHLGFLLGGFLVPWLIWGVIFYRLTRNAEDAITRTVSWLMRGSVLELLIAIPSHVIVRRRGDCCAPVGSAYGIATGIAIMMLSFGPSVLLLYKKRIEARAPRTTPTTKA